MNPKKVICPRCGEAIKGEPIKSFFLGNSNYSCDSCQYKGSLPLKTSTKITYWTITVVVGLILIEILSGGKGFIGWLGLVVPILLFRDWQLSRGLRKYWENNKMPPIPVPQENHPILKGVVFSIIVVVVSFGLGAILFNDSSTSTTTSSISSNADNWQAFNSVDGKFKIDFPQYPKSESTTETVSNMAIPMTQYNSAGANGDQYFAQFAVYPVKAGDLNVKGVLEGSVNGSVNSDNSNKLISSSFVQYGGYPAIDYVMYNGKESVYIKGRNILVGTTLYSVLFGSANQNSTNYDKFLASFELKNF